MPTTQQITDIVDKVRQRLAEAERQGIYLRIVREKFDDDWLSIVVAPSKPGARASEHAEFMSQIERELRSEGIDQVLLVPALDD